MKFIRSGCGLEISYNALETILGIPHGSIRQVNKPDTRDTIIILLNTDEPKGIDTKFGIIRTFNMMEGQEYRLQPLELNDKADLVITEEDGKTVLKLNRNIRIVDERK